MLSILSTKYIESKRSQALNETGWWIPGKEEKDALLFPDGLSCAAHTGSHAVRSALCRSLDNDNDTNSERILML